MQHQSLILLRGTLASLLLVSCVLHAQISEQRKQQLKDFLLQDCGACHGMTLKGSLGPSLLPERLGGKSAVFLQQTILEGRPGTAMPPWKALLKPEEALWIARQLLKGIQHDK